MDMTSLFYRFRRASLDEIRLKVRSLQSAFKTVKAINQSTTFEEFLKNSSDVVIRKYGGDSHDSYVTTSMSVVKNFQQDLDIYLASILNSIVIQMNFQTRIFVDGNQSVVFDGDRKYFPAAMMHGNSTQGICVGDGGDIDFPLWVNASPSLEVNRSKLHFLPDSEVCTYLNANGSSTIGALLMVDPEMATYGFEFVERYYYLQNRISSNTIFCFAGPAETIFHAVSSLQREQADLRIHMKVYTVTSGAGIRQRAVAVFSGLHELPAISIRPALSMACSFDHKIALERGEDVDLISYASGFAKGHESVEEGKAVGLWEDTAVCKPFFLTSSAPLPAEAQERISQQFNVYHSIAAYDGGMLIQSMDSSHSQFMYGTADGRIFDDYSDPPANTPLYMQAEMGTDGVRRGLIASNSVLRVKGTAMPLMFTPTLHTWHSHFMIQCLPRVRIARDREESITFLVPHDLRKKQLEMMKVLGVRDENIAFIQQHDIVKADKLYVPCPWRLVFTPYSASIYDNIALNVGNWEGSTPKRILISRESRKSWRNMINYEIVRDLLVEEFGFVVVAPEKMTLSEEVATYANADIVVGAEGAGMYGAVFSKPGTKYITLCDEDYVMPILGTIAEIRQLKIGYVFGESFRSDADVARRLPTGHADFTVDVGRVEKAVRQAIAC
ncbi:MAG: glycosyltransferase family 61 protein [Sneathiella sp.]|jgi:hypothetical protein|nr:glycosyltransferase family 61 protein [Sneathiella sp.]